MAELLEVVGITKRFGGLVAVNDVSFSVREKEILSVIGPNGAGKSTLFKLISSFLRPTSGEVRLKGERISDLAPHIGGSHGHHLAHGRATRGRGEEGVRSGKTFVVHSGILTDQGPAPPPPNLRWAVPLPTSFARREDVV